MRKEAGSMAELSTPTRTELAHRSSDGLEVTLVWVQGDEDEALVCVPHRREGAYFEVPAGPRLALHVYYNPFAHRDFSVVDHRDSRLAA
jgi:hypothetical protein